MLHCKTPNEATITNHSGPPTLDRVALDIESAAADDLEGCDRKALLAAIRRTAKWLDRDPSTIRADMRWLNQAIDRIDLGYHRISRKTVLNARSQLVKAIAIHRGLVPRKKASPPLTPAWERLRVLLTNSPAAKPYYVGTLSSLINYGNQIGVQPEQVDDAFYSEWQANYLALSTSRDPMRKVRATRNVWNTCAAEVGGWPQTTFAVPERIQFWVPEDQMHQALRQEFAEYRHYLRAPRWFRKNVRDDVRRHRRKRFAANTVEGHIHALRNAQAHMVAAGTPVEEIRSIADLVDAETVADVVVPGMQERDRVRRAERAARAPADVAEPASYVSGTVKRLYTIALNWCSPSEDDREIFRDLIAETEPVNSHGLTAKNLLRLRQFNTESNVYMLRLLPRALIDHVERERERRTKRGDAERITLNMVSTFQAGLAIAILWKCPIRRANLVAIDTNVHLVRSTVRRSTVAHLYFEAHETKTSRHLDVELDGGLLAALDLFCTDYLPVLTGRPTGYIFPCHTDINRPMPPRAFAEKVSRIIHRWTGLRMNLHLFRHLVAKLLLDDDPTNIEMVAQILGHKSTETARRNYLENTTVHATRHFDGLIRAAERAFLAEHNGDVAKLYWRVTS